MWELVQSYLEVEMKNKYSIINKKKNTFMISFLRKYDFTFLNINDFLLSKEAALLIISNDVEKEDIEKYTKLFKSLNTSILLFIPNHLKDLNFFSKATKLFYPINVLKFEKMILNLYFDKSMIFKDLYLKNNNFLQNSKNELQIYLTETESEILRLLIKEKSIKKEKLKNDILQIKSTIITKSLESHLSRIRKKLQEIESNISIVSIDNINVSIN